MLVKRFQLIVIGLIGGTILLGGIACSAESDSTDGATKGSGGGIQGEDRSIDQTDGSLGNSAASDGQPVPNGGDSAEVPGDSAPSRDPNLQALLDRKIVQTTTVDVGVEDVGRAFTDIIASAEAAGGFVATSVFSNSDDKQSADLTIRVPADQYQSVLGKVRGMGAVSNEGSDANDVTEEYTDLQARLRTLEATEQRYLELLGRAENINDILIVQDRLDGVRGQIEQTQGRIDLLDHLTELATITIHLRPIGGASGGGGAHPIEAAQAAWQYSLDTLRALATVGLAVAAFSWWLVPPAIVAGLSTRWWRNRKSRMATEGTV